jgi:hypothetical protein
MPRSPRLCVRRVPSFLARKHGRGRRVAYRRVLTSIGVFRPTLLCMSLSESDLVRRLAPLRAQKPTIGSDIDTPYDGYAAEVEDLPSLKRAAVRWTERSKARNFPTADHTVTQLGVDPRMSRVAPGGRRPQAREVRTVLPGRGPWAARLGGPPHRPRRGAPGTTRGPTCCSWRPGLPC